MMKKVTMQDIADGLGVSKGLVSIALAGKYGVSQDMRAQIVIKAIEMGYSFKKTKKNNVTLFIRSKEDLQEQFWHYVVKGIEVKLNSHNFNFNIAEFYDQSKFQETLELLVNSRACGIIMINANEEIVEKFKITNIPIVLIDITSENCFGYDTVMAHNYEGGYMAAKYLVEKMGHRRLACYGNPSALSFTERLRGFLVYAETHGVPVDVPEAYLPNQGWLDEAGEEKLLRERRFSAIFCVNDPMAVRLMTHAKRLGIRVPEELSVMGMDNVSEGEQYECPLTTVNIPKLQLGETAVDLLLSRIDGNSAAAKYIEVGVDIVERSSVAKQNSLQ